MMSNEKRWEKFRRMKIIIGEKVFYIGWDDDLYYEGVVVIVEKGMENYLME